VTGTNSKHQPTIYNSSSEPGPKHLIIVVLEAYLVDLPLPLDIQPCTYEVKRYCQTSQDQVLSRIRDATVVVAVTLKFDAELLSVESTPKLKLISYAASGVDGVDIATCTWRGITVCNASGACAAAISEHALGLYFALRRRLVQTHLAVQANQWTERSVLNGMMKGGDGRYPMSCKEEVMGLIGYGQLGKSDSVP
jgi:lactate dehydrogenase-like 2-hydroxyacid dehydrogenase